MTAIEVPGDRRGRAPNEWGSTVRTGLSAGGNRIRRQKDLCRHRDRHRLRALRPSKQHRSSFRVARRSCGSGGWKPARRWAAPTALCRLHRECSPAALSRKQGREPAADRVECRNGSALLPPPSLPARDHPARDLALSPLHPELSRCRGAAGQPRARHLLRNGAALGSEVRSRDRATAAPGSPAAERSLASRRDGGSFSARRRASSGFRQSTAWPGRRLLPRPVT
jgi:hypothetical protein